MDMHSAYLAKIADHQLQPDEAQGFVVRKLAELSQRLNAAAPPKPSHWGKFFTSPTSPPSGLYIHGGVGRGKTMLMDLFFETVEGWPKQRIHFHAFMQDVHKARSQKKTIEQIADQLAKDATLLCLDEMQIVDIADAMIIGRLFEAMHARGVVLVTTSNLAPDQLYKDGLNRDLFLPFIEKLIQSLEVICLASMKDYRVGRIRADNTYLHPASADNRVLFNAHWQTLTEGAQGRVDVLSVLGRGLTVPKAARNCASFTFYELCGEPLGPADYLAIASAYRTIFISGVPKLKAHQRNETKRFILMIDSFYDARTRLIFLADGPLDSLFPKNQHSFESARTLSRLREMQSASWWGKTIVDT
jgi:cell division protein ZapE